MVDAPFVCLCVQVCVLPINLLAILIYNKIMLPVNFAKKIKFQVVWHKMDNTLTAHTNTTDCVPGMPTPQGYVCIPVCTVCFWWNICKQQFTVLVEKPQKKNERNTSCLRSDGQHAPCTCQHCRLCSLHTHDVGVHAHTCSHGLFSLEHLYQQH